jgi:hypothetical protein
MSEKAVAEYAQAVRGLPAAAPVLPWGSWPPDTPAAGRSFSGWP